MGFIMDVVGIGLKVGGSLQQGAYAAQVARNNATEARTNAEYTRNAGMAQASIVSQKGAAKSGTLKAQQAASGIDVNSGSAVDVQAGQREADTLDAETVLTNAELSAYGYSTQARDFEDQAVQEETSSMFNALGSLVEGSSQIASKAAGMGGKGMGGKGGTGFMPGYGTAASFK